MNCSEAGQFFDAYLDGELTGSLRLEFDAHRLRCTACQQKLAMMEACEHILAGDTRGPKFSPNFTNNVMNEIRHRGLTRPLRPRRRMVYVAAGIMQAAAVIVFAFLWVNYWRSPAPVQPPGSNSGFDIAVGQAIENKDRVEITKLMTARLEQLRNAQSNLSDDVRALAGYAPSLWNLSEWPQATDNPSGLFEMITGGIFNQVPAENGEPPTMMEAKPRPDASGTYSL